MNIREPQQDFRGIMNNKKKEFHYINFYIKMLCIYLLLAGIFYVAAGEQLYFRKAKHTIEAFPADTVTGDITAGKRVEQTFYPNMTEVQRLAVMLTDYGRDITGTVRIELWDKTAGALLAEQVVMPEEIGLNQYFDLKLEQEILPSHKAEWSIVLTSDNGEENRSAAALYLSSKELKGGRLRIDGQETPGALCMIVEGRDEVWTGNAFIPLLLGIGAALSAFYWFSAGLHKNGKKDILFTTLFALKKYGFLIEQLVKRDFKIRYKRSVLGVLWSFLNPLLTMVVQYIVFSQLFRSDIENFPVYLLSGLVVFNFFNEAVSIALGSIVYSASLITKVYVPKYIYPISKVLSSSINLAISIVPLFLAMALTGEAFTKSLLMLPFLMICVIGFSIGIGMLLSALMVFFRDTQFLWGIVSLLWMYLTPIFYPVSIVSKSFAWIYPYNPMYHFVNFIRILLMDGISPEPRAYVQCALAAVIALLIGGFTFKKTQDKFILNI